MVKHGKTQYIDGNIMFSPWIPQNDLLGHPKTVAFVTHCGNSGQFEALYHGIPMIGFPLFADQYYNCERMKRRVFRVVLDFCTFDSSDILLALSNVTQNNFKQSIRKASYIFRHRLVSPIQKASYWVDHVVKYGHQYIRSPSVDMPWYRYYLTDVIVFVLMVSSTILTLVLFICLKFLNQLYAFYIFCTAKRLSILLKSLGRAKQEAVTKYCVNSYGCTKDIG